MVCGECGATIADKAIVCYRCGAPTETPVAPVRPRRPVRRPLPVLVLVLLLVAALVLAWLALDAPAESPSRLRYAIGSVVAFVVGAWLAVRRRVRKS